MSTLVDKDARLAAMANLAKHFLSQAYGGGNTAEEREARHDAIKDEVFPCGLFDAHDVVWFFYLLEERGIVEINKFALLAQTTDPDAMLPHGVPKAIVDNAKVLKGYHRKAAQDDSARAASAQKEDSRQRIAFIEWAKASICMETHLRKIRITDVQEMNNFDPAWSARTDKTLRGWVKEAVPGFEFARGREKKKK